MESKNSSLAILHEPFVAGMDENLSPIMQRLWKLEGGAIYFCRSGWAHVTIDLKDYEIVENTQIVLLPGTIIRINGNSSDFTAMQKSNAKDAMATLTGADDKAEWYDSYVDQPPFRADLLPVHQRKTVLYTQG